MLSFLFREDTFIRLSTEHDTAQNILGAEDLRRSYAEGNYKPNVEYTRELAQRRTSELRQSFRHAFFWVLCSTLLSTGLGFALECYFGICPQLLSSLLQLVGVAIILWATILGIGLGCKIDGWQLVARTCAPVGVRIMYVVGSSLFFLAYAWGTKWIA